MDLSMYFSHIQLSPREKEKKKNRRDEKMAPIPEFVFSAENNTCIRNFTQVLFSVKILYYFICGYTL